MTTGALAALLFAVALFLYVFAPVRDFARGKTKSRADYLRERKDVVYENLRDLTFEFKAGKFPEADYLAMRDSLEAEAATIIAEMENLERV
jgi:hypothetical protein